MVIVWSVGKSVFKPDHTNTPKYNGLTPAEGTGS